MTFTKASKIDWIDRGNIDYFEIENGAFHIGGDRGDVRIFSTTQPTMHIDR